MGPRLSIALVVVALSSCAPQARQFQQGLYNISGIGANTSRDDAMLVSTAFVQMVRKNDSPPPLIWETPLPNEAVDILQRIDAQRILVGIFEIDGDLGAPSHGPLQLRDAGTGRILWQAARKSFPRGQYTVLSAEKAIVLFGGDGENAELLALDPQSGVRRWGYTLKGPYRLAITQDGEQIVVSSAAGSRRSVRAIALASGAVAWTINLDGAWFDPKQAGALHVTENAVFVAGRRLVKLALARGQTMWVADNSILSSSDGSVMPESAGIFLWNASSVALLRPEDGRTLWNASPPGTGAKLVAFLDGRVVRVASVRRDSPDLIQALDIGSGRMLWSRDAGGVIVSALASSGDALLFSTDETVVAVEPATGELRFRSEIPPSLLAHVGGTRYAPSTQRGALPDHLRIHAGRLYLARDTKGIAAYELPAGKLAWVQAAAPHLFSAPNLQATLDAIDAGLRSPDASPVPAASTLSSPGPSPALKSAQGSYDLARSRYLSTQGSTTASASERSSARTRYLSASSALETQERMEAVSASFQQAQAIAGAGIAAVDALAAAKKARDAERAAHAAERARIRLTGAHYAWQKCFQENLYVQPFGGLDRGVMLVDLETGMRSDVVFAVLTPLEQNLGVDFQNPAIDWQGKRLVVAGTSLAPERWQEEVKWRTRRPKPSLLAYDVSALKFERVTRRQIDAEKLAAAKPDLITLIIHEDVGGVRRALQAGANVNAPEPTTGTTPIQLAAGIGNEALVRLLLEYGADPTIRNKSRANAYDTAKKHPAILRILRSAKPQR